MRVEAWKPPKQELVELLDRVADAYVQATRLKASAPVLFAGFQHPVPGPARLPSGDVPPAACNADDTALEQRARGRRRVDIGYILGRLTRRLKRRFSSSLALADLHDQMVVLTLESFESAMVQRLASALQSHSTLLLALVDLDNLANPAMPPSSEKADHVFRDFVRQAHRSLGRNDLLARITDTRFGILAEVESANDGERFALALHTSLTTIPTRAAQAKMCGMGALLVTPLGWQSSASLMSHAERLLSSAKSSGRNIVEIARSETDGFRRVRRHAAFGNIGTS